MTANEANWDRIVRVLAGLALAYGAVATWPGGAQLLTGRGAESVGLLVLAIVALVTGISGVCPGYGLLGISTRGKPAH